MSATAIHRACPKFLESDVLLAPVEEIRNIHRCRPLAPPVPIECKGSQVNKPSGIIEVLAPSAFEGRAKSLGNCLLFQLRAQIGSTGSEGHATSHRRDPGIRYRHT